METLNLGLGSYGLNGGNGIDLCAYHQAQALTKMGHNVTIYTFQKNLPDIPGARILELPQYRKLWKMKVFAPTAKKHDFFVGYGSPWFLLSKHTDNNVMVEFGTPSIKYASTLREAFFWQIIRLETIMSAGRARLVLPGSRYLQQTIEDYAKKCFVNHSGINFTGSEQAEKLGVSREDKPPYVLYVGRHTGYKNVPRLAKLFKRVRERVPNALFLTAGSIDRRLAYRTVLFDVMANTPGMMHLGFVDNLWPLYRGASVCVNASSWEGEDRPLLEAQAVGTPALAYDNCSHPEVVHHGRVVSNDDEYVDAMVDYLTEDQHTNTICSFIREEYGAETVARRLVRRLQTA